jgi:6-phosphogluconolactonase (cycloisomerase 2 family)
LGSTPRNFCLIDGGGLLLVANLRSDSVTTFAVDEASGALTPLATTKGIPKPFWIGAPPNVSTGAERARRAA